MKRAALLKTITGWAKRQHLDIEWREGGRHTVVRVGGKQTSIPRHGEINEITARQILKQLGIKEKR